MTLLWLVPAFEAPPEPEPLVTWGDARALAAVEVWPYPCVDFTV